MIPTIKPGESVSDEKLAELRSLVNWYFGPRVGQDLEKADSKAPKDIGAPLMFRGFYCSVMKDVNGEPFINIALDSEGNLEHVMTRRDLHKFLMRDASNIPRSTKWRRFEMVCHELSVSMSAIKWVYNVALGRGPKLVGERVHWRNRFWKVIGCLLYTSRCV